MNRALRAKGDAGQVGGIEVIPFGVLTFLFAMLLIVNVWGVIDSELSTSSAAREAVRAFVESPDEAAAVQRAESAATQVFAGHGRSSSNTAISISYIGAEGWSRCSRVTVTVRHPVPALRLPVIGGFGHGFDAVASQSEIVDPYRSGVPGDAKC